MSEWTLAIDYGTTYTAAAVGRRGGVDLLYFNGVPRIPSLVLRNPGGEILVGTTAENETLISPDRVLRAPKRRLGDRMVLLGDAPLAVVDAVAAVLAAVLEEARRQQGGGEPTRVVMTHPARWGSERLAALREACRKAGLPEPQFIPEPVAAALHYMATGEPTVEPGQRVSVYDLGGGTFDTAVLERRADGGFDIVATGGNEYLGGEDFDETIYRHFGGILADQEPQAWEQLRHSEDRPWKKANAEFRRDVRQLKEDLSSTNARSVYIRYPVDRDLQLTRVELETLLRRELDRTLDELGATIQRAGSKPEELAAIYLVGGSSRIRLLPQLVRERFGRADTRDDPKAVVALGAARAEHLAAGAAPVTSEPVTREPVAAPQPPPAAPTPASAETSEPEPVRPPSRPERIASAAVAAAAVAAPAAPVTTCPQCGRARNGTARYCNGCGHDYAPAPDVRGEAVESAPWHARVPRDRRAGLAAGAVAALGVLALAVFLGGNLASGGETSEPTPALDTVAAEQLEVGDCFSPVEAGEASPFDRVEVVPCDEPHMYEVYHAFEYPIAGERYPSAAAFRANADACDEEAEDFIGAPPEDVDLKKVYLVPLEDQWTAGDRTITCVLYDDDERPMTGSQRNAGDEN